MRTSGQAAGPGSGYSFDNDDPESTDRHTYLADLLDGFTRERLLAVGELAGRRCLEVGAGGGSVAGWLAGQAGPDGRVLATDVNVRHLPTDAGFDVLRHDVVAEPVPHGPWDVVHARLVLLHLPRRREVLARLAAALAPGGALVVEEWATAMPHLVLAAPDDAAAELVDRYHVALTERVLPSNGNDPRWALQVHGAMLEEGLVDVETHVHCRSWAGGTPGALLMWLNVAQQRERFLAAGFTAADQDRLRELVHDPRLVVRGHFTFATTGRRPGAPA